MQRKVFISLENAKAFIKKYLESLENAADAETNDYMLNYIYGEMDAYFDILKLLDCVQVKDDVQEKK